VLVLNIQQGLLATKRLSFGVKTAPAIFQACMDKVLSGIDKVFCYIDDILVATEEAKEHLTVLKKVFDRLEQHNVRLNGDKCEFFKSEVTYLGHVLSADGIRPLQNKVEAIQKAPRPKNVSELKSFLGMVNYYGKFVPNLASRLHPMYALLHHSTEWNWTQNCEDAFNYAKEVLSGDQVLAHFDSKTPLVLSVDASPYGLGAVLSHRYENGEERPIAFASRTLSAAEQNYAQIEKEGLAIVFGLKKFNLYLFGKEFTLITDHKPLTHIFGPKSGIPPLAAARMQRWALLLSGYQYKIEYRSSQENANADLLSRLPVGDPEGADPDENYVFSTVCDTLPVTAADIARYTSKYIILAKVYDHTMSGWSACCNEPYLQPSPYFDRRHELSIEDGCILWGRRVIIPQQLQRHMLNELHEGHPGMTRMKALARSFVWWSGLDNDIEDMIRVCSLCLDNRKSPKPVPLLLWPWATEPWQRLHVDYCEIKGQQFLLIVDG
jgi:hypothetical protein